MLRETPFNSALIVPLCLFTLSNKVNSVWSSSQTEKTRETIPLLFRVVWYSAVTEVVNIVTVNYRGLNYVFSRSLFVKLQLKDWSLPSFTMCMYGEVLHYTEPMAKIFSNSLRYSTVLYHFDNVHVFDSVGVCQLCADTKHPIKVKEFILFGVQFTCQHLFAMRRTVGIIYFRETDLIAASTFRSSLLVAYSL